MKKLHLASLKRSAGRHASRRGAFSAGLTALAVAAVVLFNLLTAQLPPEWTQFDMTGSGVGAVSDVSRDYLAGVEEDVEIHVLAAEDSVDPRISRFLDRYAALSDHLTLEYTDPLVFPSVLSLYGAEAGDVVVLCPAAERQERFPISDVIGVDLMSYYYYGVYRETDFDAEGLLTSAVDAVLTGATRTVYTTAGHGETPLPLGAEDLFSKVHMAVSQVNLLMGGGVPEDCDLLILNAPERDLADDELKMVLDYLASGGHVVYNMSSRLDAKPNLDTLCTAYGITPAEGLIADTERCYRGDPYLFFPLVDSTTDAAAGFGGDSTVLFYASRGMTLTDPVRDTVTVQSFLSTSENGVAVAPDGTQIPGTYAVAAAAAEAIDDNLSSRLTVFGSDSLISPDLNGSFSNLDNQALFLSAASCGFADVRSLAIPPVSLETPVNTITTGGIWALLFILVIPAALLGTGFVRWMRRRKL